MLEELKSSVSVNSYNFIISQVRAFSVHPRGMRWSATDKRLALNLYLKSPAAYRVLRKYLQLPSKSTLKRSILGVAKAPGFCPVILQAVKNAAASMPDVQKMCILSFDEMHIKTQLQYLSASDSVVGLENFGQEHPPRPGQKPATEALCFMVRSIAGKWKQLLGYFFSSSSTPSDILQALVFTALQHLAECGLKVVGVVCDQGPTNQKLFSQLGVSPERPFFVFGTSTVFALFDPPHLLKSVRNILSKYNIRFGGSKMAKWSAIEYFYSKDSQNVYKVAPKLTNQHINVKNKMRVKYAAQVLSHSVAAGLCMIQTCSSSIDDYSGTAEFVEQMDELFDMLNSRSLSHTKLFARAITATSTHVAALETKQDFIRSWEVVTVEGRHASSPPCKRGWLITIAAVLQMWEQLRVEGLSFLMTNRLNQDCLENSFSVIRQKGGFRDSPDTEQFKASVKALMTENLMRSGQVTNCEEDFDEVLLCAGSFSSWNLPSEVIVEEGAGESAEQSQLDDPVDAAEGMEIFEKNAAAYLAGYCVNRAVTKVGQCSQCVSLMTIQKVLSPHLMLLYFKEYDPTLMTQGLKWPSETVVAFVEQGAEIFNTAIAGRLHEAGLYRMFCRYLNLEMLCAVCCPEHRDVAAQTLSHVLFLILVRTKLREINLTFKKPCTTRHMRHALHQ